MKKTAIIIKNIEKKSTHLRKNKKNQKTNDSKKRKRINDVFDKKSNDDRFNVFTEFNKNAKKNKDDKKNKKKIYQKSHATIVKKKDIIRISALMSKKKNQNR